VIRRGPIEPGTRVIITIPRADIEEMMVGQKYGWLTTAEADEILQFNGLKGTVVGPADHSPTSCSMVDLDDYQPPVDMRNRWTRPLTILDKIAEAY
jgi:hypothetical protein